MARCGIRSVGRAFPRPEPLVTTTRGGPPMEDCIVDDVSDYELNKKLEEADDIRVELTMKGAMSMY